MATNLVPSINNDGDMNNSITIKNKSPLVALHTGAGKYSTDLENLLYSYVDEACKRGMQTLLAGGSAVEAVTEVSAVLEDCPHLNAGVGSQLTNAGVVELEASVIDGRNQLFGCVSGCTQIRNPIKLAMSLLKNSSKGVNNRGLVHPCILSGQGTVSYAMSHGMDDNVCASSDLLTATSLRTYENFYNQEESNGTDTMRDTIGALCVDTNGNVAASCSSGGLFYKHPGRVGPSGVFGAGCYADTSVNPQKIPSVASCVSGTGEIIIRAMLAKRVCDRLATSSDPTTPLCDILSNDLLNNAKFSVFPEPHAGILCLIHNGESTELMWGHTTKHFGIGYMYSGMKKTKYKISKLQHSYTKLKSSYNVSSILINNNAVK